MLKSVLKVSKHFKKFTVSHFTVLPSLSTYWVCRAGFWWWKAYRSPQWSRFPGTACDPGRAHTVTGCAWGTAPHGRVTHTVELWAGLLLTGWTHTEEIHGEWSPMGRTPHKQRKYSPPWAAAGTTCDELIIMPVPWVPALLGRRGRAGKDGVVGGRGFFKVSLYFSLFCSDFVSNKFN